MPLNKKICILSQGAYPLLVNSSDLDPIGGAEVQLVTLGKQFAVKGYNVHFIVDDFNQPNSIKSNEGIIVKKMPLRYMGGSNYYLMPDWINLFIALWKVGAEIHIIKLPNHLLFPVGIYCKLFKKKLIFICQIDRDVNLRDLKRDTNIFEYYFYKMGLKFTDHIVAQNEAQRKGLSKFYSKDISVIRNILSLDIVEKIPKEKFVLWVGSNLARKRPEIFIKIAKKCQHLSFKMIMSTSKVNPDDSDIKNQCLGIRNIEYLGPVPFHQIGKFFQMASILMSTSESEGFPNIFLQAWQCKTPVVSLEIDPDGLIRQREMGRVSRSIEKMISDVEELMSNDELRDWLGENGKKYVDKYHNSDKIVNEYYRLFETLTWKD
jgi:glycosyltransferase involved in cell wall biosynthesis